MNTIAITERAVTSTSGLDIVWSNPVKTGEKHVKKNNYGLPDIVVPVLITEDPEDWVPTAPEHLYEDRDDDAGTAVFRPITIWRTDGHLLIKYAHAVAGGDVYGNKPCRLYLIAVEEKNYPNWRKAIRPGWRIYEIAPFGYLYGFDDPKLFKVLKLRTGN